MAQEHLDVGYSFLKDSYVAICKWENNSYKKLKNNWIAIWTKKTKTVAHINVYFICMFSSARYIFLFAYLQCIHEMCLENVFKMFMIRNVWQRNFFKDVF